MSKSQWSQSDIDRINERNKAALNQPVVSTPVLPVKSKTKPKIANKDKCEAKQFIEGVLKNIGLPFVTELQFAPPRKFRFDYAIPSQKIAIEYEGIMGGKSRHTTISGYTNDCIKYTMAAVNGWRVLRYTAINYGDVVDDLSKMGLDVF